MDFIAIDFETANEKRASPCAIGVAIVRSGSVLDCFGRLIRPPEFRFSTRNVAIHGIRPEDVENEPEFPQVWETMKPLIENATVLAHSASFDVSVLTSTLDYYEIPRPTFHYLCTMRVAKAVWPSLGSYTLPSVATKLGITLDHHRAADDAMACAQIATRACEEARCGSIAQLACQLGIAFGEATRCCSSRASEFRQRCRDERKAAEVTPQILDFDPAHPLFGRVVAFTGPLISMTRDEAMQCVANLGGQPADSVTKKTDFLVVGGRYFDVFSHRTGKLKKATEMVANGSPLDIIGENEFLEMLSE